MTEAVAVAPGHRLAHPLAFDITGPGFKEDPLPTFAAMRAAGPVIPIRLPFVGRAWVTTTYAATEAMVKDNGLFVQEGRHAGKSGVAGFSWWMPKPLRLMTNNMLQKDEPDHRRLRRLVDHAFARRDVQAMRGAIATLADGLLDSLAGQAEVDLAAQFSRRLPLMVIADLLGLPAHERDDFAELARKGLSITSMAGLFLGMGWFDKMIARVRRYIEDARREARPGLIGELVRAEADGEKLDEAELLSMIVLLLIAGFETTTHLISDSVIALERHPEQKAWLLADPEARMERAVEELARFTSPVQSTKPRYVARDAAFFGAELKRGDLILALIAAADADPAVFDRPDELRLDRFPNPHLVFSSGIHFCLGQQLARVETQVALARLYARFPNLALASADIAWLERLGVRGPKTLPVRLGARAQPSASCGAPYAAASSPASAFSIRATVRSTPKIATKEPKRGPVGWPSRTS
jgi:cytochrome P450